MMDTFKLFFSCVGVFFILYMIGYASFLFLAVTVGSSTLYQLRRRNQLKNELLQHYYVPVTIVVPAHNEEVTIQSTVQSLLSLEYTLYEIVIVDDGSTDQTAQLLRETFRMHQVARPIHRSIPCQEAVAVGGAVRPCNGAEIQNGRVISYHMPRQILPCMQVLEYDRSFLAARILFDKFNGSIIISGAFGLFKKSVVIDAGGYDATTMGEDMELVVKLHVFCREHGLAYRVRYATDAICWTQAPEKLEDLCKQRRRWHIGLFQTMTRHRRMLANPKYGLVGLISYLYFLIYELLSPYIELFGLATIAVAFAVDLINVPFMILFFIIYVLYSAILSLTAFFARIHTIDLKLIFSDVLKAIGLCVLEVSCLRFILAWVRATALIGYKKKKQAWGTIERKKINFD